VTGASVPRFAVLELEHGEPGFRLRAGGVMLDSEGLSEAPFVALVPGRLLGDPEFGAFDGEFFGGLASNDASSVEIALSSDKCVGEVVCSVNGPVQLRADI
jgi:hypothetical protein